MQPSRRTVLGGAAATLALAWAAPRADATGLSPLASSPSCVLDPHADKTDLRGIWIASVTNIDWPSRPGLTPAAAAGRARRGTTTWRSRSTTTPSSCRSARPPTRSGRRRSSRGRSTSPAPRAATPATTRWPSRSPRPTAATSSSTPGSTRTGSPWTSRPTSPASPPRTRRSSTRSGSIPYGGKLYYNPGIPEAREYCQAAIMDAVTKYDIDAVHFDDYFYPYPVAGEVFHDEAQYAQYGAGRSLADWRRRQHQPARSPELRLARSRRPSRGSSSASRRSAVWRTRPTTRAGRRRTAGVQTYDDLYADTRRWVREEWIDYICPQVYWAESLAVADYNVIVDWWANVVAGRNVHLYIGQATYKIGASTQSPEWNDLPQEMSNHLLFNSTRPRGGRQHLLQRQGRPRQPARRHGDRRARLVPPPRPGAADAVDRRVGPARRPRTCPPPWAGRGRPSGGVRVTPRPSRMRCTGSR